MAIVPTVRLLITAIAATPRLATTLHRLRAVIRRLAATAPPRVVAIMVAAAEAAASRAAAEAAVASTAAGEAAVASTAAGEAALTAVVADLMAVTADL